MDSTYNPVSNPPVRVGSQFGLESLVLLMFGLNVGRFFVRFVGGSLQLLGYPSLDFVAVARKLLQRLMLAQFGPLFDQSLLQLLPTIQHLTNSEEQR